MLNALGREDSIDSRLLDTSINSILQLLKNSGLNLGFRLEGAKANLNNIVLLAELTQEDAPLGSNLQGSSEPKLIDLRDVTDSVMAIFEVYWEAAFDNEVGFFEIEDVTSQLLDSQGNLIGISDDGYILAAMQKRIDVSLKIESKQMRTYTAEIGGGKLLSSFVVSNGSVAELLDSDAGNDPAVYLSHVGANSDRTSLSYLPNSALRKIGEAISGRFNKCKKGCKNSALKKQN